MQRKCEDVVGCRSADFELPLVGGAVCCMEGDRGFDGTERRSQFSKWTLCFGF